jgi:hypothetical protein
MFIRFRQTPHRLQVSIVETRRVDGKVRHEHVASLGSIETPPTVADRVAFWQRINDRLAKLSNRVDMATQGKMRGDLHGRVPMVTPDEQRALQLENAEAEDRFWSGLHDVHASTVADHKGRFAVSAGVSPRYGTLGSSIPVIILNSSAARCAGVPFPAVAMVIFLGLALA